MRTDRIADPEEIVRRHRADRLGYRDQRGIGEGLDEALRRTTVVVPTIAHSIEWWRDDVGAAGNAAYSMRVGTPSSSAAWASTSRALVMPAAFYVVGGFLWSNASTIAGTATLQVRIVDPAGTVDKTLTDCVLSAALPSSASCVLPNSTIKGAKGATIQPRVVTAGSFATNAGDTFGDLGALILIAYDL